MKPSELKDNLGKVVHLKNYHVDADYILSAIIIRKGDSGFVYQAELTDIKQSSSVLICQISKIEGKENG